MKGDFPKMVYRLPLPWRPRTPWWCRSQEEEIKWLHDDLLEVAGAQKTIFWVVAVGVIVGVIVAAAGV